MSDSPVVAFNLGPHDHQSCVRDALDAARRVCAARDLRLTTLRRRVLELIWRHHRPIGAYELLEMLRDERRGAAPATVYRALDFLLDCGLIHRIESLNAYVGCGKPESPHAGHFMICRVCRALAELDDPELEARIDASARRAGFRVERQTVEILGLCPLCSETDAKPTADDH